jgi:collagenase-like PrtC family protease
MHVYEDMGIDKFKITGRSKPAEWLPEVTGAYLQRRYDGNLIRLLGIDPSLNAEQWLTINNRSLDGFLEGFPNTGDGVDEEGYCDDWASRLYASGDIRLSDGTEYWSEGKTLRLRTPGCKVSNIIKRENRTK